MDNLIGKKLDGRYLIESLIGVGGMANVYKGRDVRTGNQIAVKVLKEEFLDNEELVRRFKNESKAISILNHPNIVKVYDVSVTDQLQYIVMEYIDGITLKEYLKQRNGALTWKEVVHFATQVLSALDHAHSKGIVHRDVKPQNIMLQADGSIKMMDFGIARFSRAQSQTVSDKAIGSVHYISPEQAKGDHTDARTDIYSVGVMMYEMLTGGLPFTGNTLGEIAVQHMNAKPVPPHEKNPEIPLELERITLKAMSAELSERYQSANELLSDLEAFIHTPVTIDGESADYENPDVKPVRSSTELSRERYRLRRRRSGVVSFMSGTFGLLVLAVALFAFLWNFWLKDVFSPAERIALPNFEGSNYESIINNTELSSMYKFNVIYISDDSVEPGIVISQSPAAGRSMMVTPSGIEVDLTVNAGVSLTSVPDVLNTDYRDAMRNLRAAGFNVEIENAASDSYTKDYVIATSPVAGEQLSSGSTVYITVSAGPEIQYVSMPNLVGSTEDSAISRIESSNLSYGGSDRVVSDYEAGTVIDQSISSSESVAEHTKVYLTVSSGPQG